MAAPRALPDPVFECAVGDCLRCGYQLKGLTAPGPCPECGLSFEDCYLVLCGVANRSAGSMTTRRIAWIVLAVIAGIYSQAFGLMLMFSPVACLLVGLALATALVGMMLTGKRDRRGQERFVFGSRGVVCLPLVPTDEGAARLYVGWPSFVEVTTRRISPFWQRLRIRSGELVVLDAGIRCPEDQLTKVELRISELAAMSGGPAVLPVAPEAPAS